jgi:hypothetical protein
MPHNSTANSPASTATAPYGMLSDVHLRMLRNESGIAEQSIAIPLTLEDWRGCYA